MNELTKSAELYERAKKVMPGGCSRNTILRKPHPVYAQKGEGCIVTDIEGVQRIDFANNVASLIHGHAYQPIVEGVQKQLANGTAFSIGTEIEVDYADQLVARNPSFEKLRFVNSGTEAVMSCLKAARAYSGRAKIAKVEGSYHGLYDYAEVSQTSKPANWGDANAPTSVPVSQGTPQSALDDVIVIPFNEPERAIAILDQHKDKIAGVLLDLLPHRIGVIPATEAFVKALRSWATSNGALLIFDEVITGFGRLGCCFAANRFDVRPDMITMAKGLTSAMIPMSAVAFDTSIYDQLMDGPEAMIELFHGYTYSGHPVACAAGIATLDVYEEEGLFDNAKEMEPHFEDAIHSLKGLNQVIDIRNIGLMGAIHFGSEGLPATEFAAKVFQHCYENDVLVRYSGEFLVLSPSLIVEPSHIEKIADALKTAINSVS